MSAEATASAWTQPVRAMTIAAMITAPDPRKSPMTSRYAPRMLRLSRWASRSRSIEHGVRTEADEGDHDASAPTRSPVAPTAAAKPRRG